MILLLPGTTYNFRLATETTGNTFGAPEEIYLNGSVILTVTIPA